MATKKIVAIPITLWSSLSYLPICKEELTTTRPSTSLMPYVDPAKSKQLILQKPSKLWNNGLPKNKKTKLQARFMSGPSEYYLLWSLKWWKLGMHWYHFLSDQVQVLTFGYLQIPSTYVSYPYCRRCKASFTKCRLCHYKSAERQNCLTTSTIGKIWRWTVLHGATTSSVVDRWWANLHSPKNSSLPWHLV